MKEVRVFKDDKSGIRTSIATNIPIPTPSPTQLLIKVVVSGSNPKDWKTPIWFDKFNGSNSGDDISGIIVKVGGQVSSEFRFGDRVAAFHTMRQPGGSFAEYAVAEYTSAFHLPENISFEEGATIPLAAMTAAVGLFAFLGLPEPWNKAVSETRTRATKGGIIIYGAASAVGAYAIKFCQRADLHPLICVAGNGIPFVESLIDRSKGDTIVDYREGDEAVVKGLRTAIPQGQKCYFAFDMTSEKGSYANILQVLEHQDGHITFVIPGKKYEGIPAMVNQSITAVGSTFADKREFGYAWYRVIALGLKDGWLKPHPHEVVPGGLEGVERGLLAMKNGQVSAKKMVFRIADTPGLRDGEEGDGIERLSKI